MHKGKVYCTAGNGTAYEYPLFDSDVYDGPDGKPIIRCKFDRTTYSLVRDGPAAAPNPAPLLLSRAVCAHHAVRETKN